MNKLIDIKGSINRVRFNSQELKDQISSLKEDTISTQFYLCNLKRLSLQALDLFNAMEKQVCFLSNQKTLENRRQHHGISVGR